MPKQTCTILLITIIIGGLTYVNALSFAAAQTATPVNGIITQDTTWTKTNSPYNLTGNVLIDSGVTVTVQEKAVVNLNGYYIRVNGTLIIQPGVSINMGTRDTSTGNIQVNGILSARGTSSNPILINGAIYYWKESPFAPPSYSSIAFSGLSSGWDDHADSGCIIEYSIIDNTSVGVSSSIKFSNNQLSGAGLSIIGDSPEIFPIVSHNSMTNKASVRVGGGSPIIVNNQLNGGHISVHSGFGIGSPITVVPRMHMVLLAFSLQLASRAFSWRS